MRKIYLTGTEVFRIPGILTRIFIAFLLTGTVQYVWAQCPAPYTLSANASGVNATTGTWTAPATGGPYLVKITAAGAKGGSGGNPTFGGNGAVMIGYFMVNSNDVLSITAGMQATFGDDGGGGGSGVYNQQSAQYLIIAGGGGGAVGGSPAGGGQVGTCGGAGSDGASGGCNGNPGSNSTDAFGGGGINGNTSGGIGGGPGIGNGGGGFGNLGGGGGGGYSGGGAGSNFGGGGGSINNGTNQTNTPGANAGGGYVTIECQGALVATTTTISSSLNPSFTTAPNNSVTFTTTGTSGGSAVSSGTVTFKDGANVIPGGGAVAVSNGTAQLTTTFSAEGAHNITATYNPAALYLTSTGSVSQNVNNHTQVSGNQFCNSLSGITAASGTNVNPTPYPSNIFVSGLSGTINTVTVSLNSFSTTNLPVNSLLLVGPGGQKFILMGNVGSQGGTYQYSGLSFVFSDAAATTISSSTVSSGTYQPTNFGFDSPIFAAPAPASPYNLPAPYGTATLTSVFGGTNPNGTWQLYLNANKQNVTIGSWCLNITVPSPSHITANAGTTPQSTVVSTAFTNALAATVTDAGGSPVNGGSVIFTAPSSGASGTFSNGTNTIAVATGADGVASAGTFTANGIVGGPYLVTAGVAGTGLTTNFSLTNNPAAATCPPSNILYVNVAATGSSDGLTWGSAFKTLQDALAFTSSCTSVNQIWVAKGTYFPDEGAGQTDNDLNSTFALKNGIAIYGGFTGTETTPGDRNWRTNITILSGDIDNDNTIANNAFHVTTGSGTNTTAILDGFTITGGNAICVGNCNTGGQFGGGMYNNIGSPTVINCIFSRNIAAEFGGGMYNVTSSPIITNCSFIGNSYSLVVAEPNVGGGIYNQNSSPTVVNCIFSGNSAFTAGAGIYNNLSSSPSIKNCTFSGNSVNSFNGGAVCTGSGNPVLLNCVFWNNRDVSGTGTANSSVFGPATVSYSLVQGQNPTGTGNLDGTNTANNPLFVTAVDPTTTPTVAGDLHLKPGSPAINAGTNTGAPSTDIDGTTRPLTIANPADMGAYEMPLAGSTSSVLSADGPTPICNGLSSNLLVTITGGTSPYTVIFKDNNNSQFTVNNYVSGTDIPVSPIATTTYSLFSVTDAGSNAGTGNSGKPTITVNARPTGSISGGGNYCSGSNTTTNLTLTVTGSGPVSGTLSDGSPFSGTAPTINIPVSPDATTTYTFATLNDANCTAQSSDLSGSATITINQKPTGSLSGSGLYCSGTNTTTNLTITATGTGTVSGTLSEGTPFSGTAPTITVSVSPTATTTYTIATLNDANCTAQSSDLSGSATVTVNSVPNATISGTTAVCMSADPAPNITFTGSGGTAPYTFSYTVNDGGSQAVTTSAGSSVTVAVPTAIAGTFIYKLLSVSDASTGQCSQIISGQTATVTVNGTPTGTASGSTTVCQNSASPAITFSGSGGTAPYTFNYTFYNDNTITAYTATGNPTIVSVPTATAGNYTYTLVSVQDASSTKCLQAVNNQSANVTVNPLPNATITTASLVTAASSGNIASVADAGTGATYSWGISNGTITAGAGSRSITYTTGNSGTVNLSVSVTGSGSCGPVNGSATIPITPLPCPNAAVTAAPYVCSGSAGNFASVANAGTGATYVWSITNGTITSGSGTRQITFTAAAYSYLNSNFVSLSVKVTNAGGGCTASSGTYKIGISPIPSAIIGAPSSVCSLSPANVASVPFACNGAIYKWSITNGNITSGSGTRYITYTAGATGMVTLSVTVTNGNGCSASGTRTITIAGLPVATITTGSSVCSGSGGHTASVPGGGTGTRYAWSITNGSINSSCNTSSITYSAGLSGSVTLTVIVTNSSGCKTSSGYKLVPIIALPNATVTAAASVCAGSAGDAASVSSAGTGASYSWTISGGTITSGSGTSGIKFTAGASGTITLTVTVTSSSGCNSTYSKRISSIGLPANTITASSLVCSSSTGNIASVSSAGTGATYAWSISNGSITSGSGTSSIKYTVGAPGAVLLTITVTNSTGCKTTGSKNVTVTALAIPLFAQIGPLCQKSTAPSLPSKSTNGVTGTWYPAKISTASLTTTTYTFPPAAGQCAGTTTMKITVKNCTTLSRNGTVSTRQVLSYPALVMDAVLFPNPAENFFTLVVKGNRKEVAEIRVFDMTGRSLNHFRTATDSPVRFGDNYAQGTYIVQVFQGTDQKVLKAIKQ